MKKIFVFIMAFFLVSCANLNNGSQVINKDKNDNFNQNEQSSENKENSDFFQPISKDDILKKSSNNYESVFLSLDGKKIDLKSLNLNNDQSYFIDNNKVSVSEVLLKSFKISADYKVSKGMTIKFNGDDNDNRVYKGGNIPDSLKNTINKILPVNYNLKINFNISDFNFDMYESKIMSIYFYPLVYQLNYNDNIYYILKGKPLMVDVEQSFGKQSMNKIYMDGFVELRFLNEK